MQLAMLNTVADKYDMYLLKNCVIDKFLDISSLGSIAPPQIPVVTYVYQNTVDGSVFRELLVAWYVWKLDKKWYDRKPSRADLAEAGAEFAIDVALALGRRMQYPDRANPFTLPSSAYHQEPSKNSDEGRA